MAEQYKIMIFDSADTEHTVIIYFENWINKWRAYSDSIGAESSPIGEGKTQKEALEDLRWQLDGMHDK